LNVQIAFEEQVKKPTIFLMRVYPSLNASPSVKDLLAKVLEIVLHRRCR
jgi:hypothetical protein